MASVRGLVAVVHPFPSVLNAILVFGLAVVARAYADLAEMFARGVGEALLLAAAMLLIQFSIGAANDWFDVERDRQTKPSKPIPAGLIGRGHAAVVAAVAGGGGLLLTLLVTTAPQPTTLFLLAAMLGAGLAYDAWLKPTALNWLPYAIAFPLLPLYAWSGATGYAPPRPELLLPVAFVAGPALQLANGLVDLESDARTGAGGLAGRLGPRWAWLAMSGLQMAIHALAWLTIGVTSPARGSVAVLALAAASAVTLAGVVLSASKSASRREWGWRCQAVGIALLAAGWVAAIPNPEGLPGG